MNARVEIMGKVILVIVTTMVLAASIKASWAASDPVDGSSLDAFVGAREEKDRQMDIAIRVALLSFADRYIEALANAADPLVHRATDPVVRSTAQDAKTTPVIVAMALAHSPSPRLGLLKMVAMVYAEHLYAKQVLTRKLGEENARDLVEAHRAMREQMWQIAQRFLDERQQDELAGAIEQWKAGSGQLSMDAAARALELTTIAGLSDSAEGGGGLLGISDAARSVDEVRILAERALHYLERLPLLVAWQAELLFYELATTPELRKTLDGLTRLPPALDGVAGVIEELNSLVPREREAAMQGLESLMTDAGPMLTNVQSTVAESRALISDAHATVELVNESVVGANELATRVDALVQVVQSSSLDLPTMRATLTELNAVVRGLNTTLATTEKMVEGAGLSPFDEMFRVGAKLILLFFATALASALLYRLITARMPVRNP